MISTSIPRTQREAAKGEVDRLKVESRGRGREPHTKTVKARLAANVCRLILMRGAVSHAREWSACLLDVLSWCHLRPPSQALSTVIAYCLGEAFPACLVAVSHTPLRHAWDVFGVVVRLRVA